jgi:hypothetical protein
MRNKIKENVKLRKREGKKLRYKGKIKEQRWINNTFSIKKPFRITIYPHQWGWSLGR